MRSALAPDPLDGAPSGRDRRSIVAWRNWLAQAFGDQPVRFAHSVGVLAHADALVAVAPEWLDPERAQRLALACLLHDVGRALDPGDRAPHGFVGADFVERAGLADVAPLVAHHSGARFEALARDMNHLDRWGRPEPDLLAVLTYFDRITSHTGRHVSIEQRRAELLARYPTGSIRVVSFDLAAADAERGRKLVTMSGSVSSAP